MAKRISNRSPINSPMPSGAYLQTLRLYWQGEKDAALGLISESLNGIPLEQSAPFYRLWIELLIEDRDEDSLRILQSHLNRRLDYKHPSWVSIYALIGFCHYELGELEGARLVQRAMRKHRFNAYFKELSLVLEPIYDAESATQAIRNMSKNTSDFFHFKRACLLAHEFQKHSLLGLLFATLREQFQQQPLTYEIGFHDAIRAKDFRRAWRFARRLRAMFPVQSTFQFYFAYTSYLLNHKQTALREFKQLNRRFGGQDPDVLNLIGATLMRGAVSEKHRIQGQRFLVKASEQLRSMGLPSAYPYELIQRLGGSPLVQSHRLWIVKLSPKQALELHQKSLDKIEYLYRAMGEYVKQGDYCFFVSEKRQASKSEVGLWRLLALYRAASNPEWHPLHRWQSALKLVVHLEVGIPIEIEGNHTRPKSALDGPQRFGLHELDGNALKYIEESIREFTFDDENYTHIFEGLREVASP